MLGSRWKSKPYPLLSIIVTQLYQRAYYIKYKNAIKNMCHAKIYGHMFTFISLYYSPNQCVYQASIVHNEGYFDANDFVLMKGEVDTLT